MGATWYEIRVQGALSSDWSNWFENMEIRAVSDRETAIAGWLADQAALHGCLTRIRDLNLPLLSVNRRAESYSPSDGREKQGE